jgi:peptidoglycan/xylan/chitin deacetylase (PgdA/CDA1 family)
MSFWPPPDLDPSSPEAAGRLAVLAYHRVGDRAAAAFDPWVFTSDQQQLEDQIQYFQKRHRIIGLEEALAIASGRERLRGTAILLTFDDGYLDNYSVALPVLTSRKAEAVFFLVSGFMIGEASPWWDRVAWLVRTARQRCFSLPTCEGPRTVDLRDRPPEEAISTVLDLYKQCPPDVAAQFVEGLESVDRDAGQPPPDRQLLGPDEAKLLCAAGMSVGAHTHSHPILARLAAERQSEEMGQCRTILEGVIGTPVDVLAYPVGGPGDFDQVTQQLARDCGYRAAFSCHGGVNLPGRSGLYDLKRIAVYWGANPEYLLD